MTNRFRMIAGPNGSGKSTLMRLLAEEYAVLNADDVARLPRWFARLIPAIQAASANGETV